MAQTKQTDMTMWIARDRNKALYIYNSKPIRETEACFYPNKSDNTMLYIDERLLPEVTFENSPQEVEIKLKIK